MKTSIINKIFFLLLFSVLAGCNDRFFEQEAPPVTEWNKIEDMEKGINTIYNSFTKLGGTPVHAHKLLHLLLGDETRIIKFDPSWPDLNLAAQRKIKGEYSGRANTLYSPLYQTIAQCNFVLDFIEGNPFPDAAGNDKINLDRVKGEALFMRAFNYYILASAFAPMYDPSGANDVKTLVLRTHFPENLTEAINNEPSTTKEIWDQMEKDLEEAVALLPLKWATGMPESYKYGRATKHAALFLLAKIQCHMGKYDDALNSLNSVLDDPNQSRALASDPMAPFTNNSYTSPWNEPEVIFYFLYADPNRFASKRHRMGEAYLYNFTFSAPNDYRTWWLVALSKNASLKSGMLTVDGKVTSDFENDKRRVLWHYWKGADSSKPKRNNEWIEDPTTALTVGKDDPLLMVDKYYRSPLPENAKTQPDCNFSIMRSAEAYLIRAGVKLEKSDAAGAASDLNVIRRRAWDETRSGPFLPLATSDWDAIDKEWIREMAFETSHILFLQMFQKPIGPGDRTDISTVKNPPYADLYFDIPIAETDFNK